MILISWVVVWYHAQGGLIIDEYDHTRVTKERTPKKLPRWFWFSRNIRRYVDLPNWYARWVIVFEKNCYRYRRRRLRGSRIGIWCRVWDHTGYDSWWRIVIFLMCSHLSRVLRMQRYYCFSWVSSFWRGWASMRLNFTTCLLIDCYESGVDTYPGLNNPQNNYPKIKYTEHHHYRTCLLYTSPSPRD